MDAEVLNERLAVTEKALIKMDQRLDALPDSSEQTETLHACEERIAALEGMIAQCLENLQQLQQTNTETELQTAEAEAAIAEAEAQISQAEAMAALAEAAIAATPTEETVAETGLMEVEPEPSSENAAVPENKPSPKWWESFLALR